MAAARLDRSHRQLYFHSGRGQVAQLTWRDMRRPRVRAPERIRVVPTAPAVPLGPQRSAWIEPRIEPDAVDTTCDNDP